MAKKTVTLAKKDDLDKIQNIIGDTDISSIWGGGSITNELACISQFMNEYRTNRELVTYGKFERTPGAWLDPLGGVGMVMCTVNMHTNTDGDITYNPPTPFGYEKLYWWNVLTFGVTNRCTQIAFFGFDTGSRRSVMWVRRQHDDTVTPWNEIAIGGEFVSLWGGSLKSGEQATLNRGLSTLGWRNMYCVFHDPAINARYEISIPRFYIGGELNLFFHINIVRDVVIPVTVNVIPKQHISENTITLSWNGDTEIYLIEILVD